MAITYTFSIPTPCSATFQEMTPVREGRFCQLCEKVVVDFSGMTDREVIAFVEKNGKCCGSFKRGQLNREMVRPSAPFQSPLSRWVPAAMVAGMLTMVWPESAKGQYKITGMVKDSVRQDPLPGVSIQLLNKDGVGTNKGTVTVQDGHFSFWVPEEYNEGMQMKLMFVGFRTKVMEVSEEQVKGKVPLVWEIHEEDNIQMGDVVIIQRASWWKRMKYRLLGRY